MPGKLIGFIFRLNMQSFPVGRLVFAKVKGFPAWPAKVIGVKLGNGCKYSVSFFGTRQTGTVRESHLWPYNKSNAAKFCTEKMKKKLEFAKGMYEMKQDESGWKHDSVIKLKEVQVMLPNSEDAFRMLARDPESRVKMRKVTEKAGIAGKQMKNGGIKKTAVKGGAVEKMKAKGKNIYCELCYKMFSMAREVAVHIAEVHLRGVRVDLLKTSLAKKNIKSRVIKGVAKKKKAGGVWEVYTSSHKYVGYSRPKGIKNVCTKKAHTMTFESRKSMPCAGGDSDDEVTLNYKETRIVDTEAVDEMNEDTEDEEGGGIENSIEQGQERRVDVNTSGAAQLRKKPWWKKLVDEQRPKSILPESCNCKEVLKDKVYMCQVGHKFCKTCLRKKKLESVDLTLTCLAHCGMDIIGRDKGMEAYLQKIMH